MLTIETFDITLYSPRMSSVDLLNELSKILCGIITIIIIIIIMIRLIKQSFYIPPNVTSFLYPSIIKIVLSKQ